MAFIVGENCIKCKHTDCVEVCPVDFLRGPNMLVIHLTSASTARCANLNAQSTRSSQRTSTRTNSSSSN